LRIAPPASQTSQPIEVETYNDHRMAMSFALAGLARPGVTILNPGCTAKTFPRFFDNLASLCYQPPSELA